MKVELHLHTSRYSACAINTPEEMMQRLVDTGYEAVYITEHNMVWSDKELDELRAKFPSLKIFPGVELNCGLEGIQHLLVLGTNDPGYIGLETADILDRARQEGLLTILAHPFRYLGGDQMLKDGLLPDAIERSTNNHKPQNAAKSEATSVELNIPIVNAGDSHSLDFLNKYWIETRRPLDAARDIRKIVLNRQYENHLAKP